MPFIYKSQFILFLVLSMIVLYFGLREEHWFPIIDSANLAFHEFGHPFFGLFSDRLMVYGGTLAQLFFPTAVSFYFYQRQETFSFSVGILWIVQNFLNIATYMADARAQQLPLVGNGEHDWTEIFSRWNCLHNDLRISESLTKLVLLFLFVFSGWLYSQVDKNRI